MFYQLIYGTVCGLFVELPVEEGALSLCCYRDVLKLLGGSMIITDALALTRWIDAYRQYIIFVVESRYTWKARAS